MNEPGLVQFLVNIGTRFSKTKVLCMYVAKSDTFAFVNESLNRQKEALSGCTCNNKVDVNYHIINLICLQSWHYCNLNSVICKCNMMPLHQQCTGNQKVKATRVTVHKTLHVHLSYTKYSEILYIVKIVQNCWQWDTYTCCTNAQNAP